MPPNASVVPKVSHTKMLLRSDQSSVGTTMQRMISTPPMVGVPALAWCALRPVFADVLADLKFLELADQPRAQRQGKKQRGHAGVGGSKSNVVKQVEDVEVLMEFGGRGSRT